MSATTPTSLALARAVLSDPPTPAEIQRLLARFIREGRMTWIYAIQAGTGPVKIGTSDDPARRLRMLQTGSAEPLHGIGAWEGLRDEERLLHAEFAPARIRGEWFEPVPALLAVVAERDTYRSWA
jgi:hypothetical protein